MLDVENCVRHIGITLLTSETYGSEPIPVSEFLHQWRDMLPELWGKKAILDALKVASSHISSENRLTLTGCLLSTHQRDHYVGSEYCG